MDQAARDHDHVGTAASADAGTPAGAQTVFNTFSARRDGPYEVGHLSVSSSGHVDVAYPSPAPVAFDFVFRGVPFHAELPGDLDAPLTMSAVLGVLPFSAETLAGRRATLEILSLAKPARGSLGLEAGGRIRANFSAAVPRPRTPVTVVATVSCLLVDLRPYLDLLAAAGALRPR
ncbi:hypothetical protein CKO28_23970 [Rhodovibrio sodomensis]|uniref:Htaa domain-containing protein n=1 Tax=Rhodovibrio sodomensis TaxID=1088 RepID=A0ABS1DLS4_9PROT|nr:hypothetical protein [Rhodovibrio sodomensis]MBK1671068.1 hypothetical protein [Rhodovibrio sodomensis]